MDNQACSLCCYRDTRLFQADRKREFFLCEGCGLVSVPEKYYLSEEDEKARYDLHENNSDNKGYIDFLNNFVSVIRPYIKGLSSGLDFGSGPSPLLAGILSSLGYEISIFDPFYANDRSVPGKKFDFITLVEVLEHLKDPEREFKMLWECLNPGGVIGIKTKFLPEKKEEFPGWSYKNDLTHICFYSKLPFEWIAERFNAKLIFPADDIVLMFKT
ncbi:MAG: class I SAM-dependent methyltransferase [Acidobacteriota bacterium]